MTAEISTPTPKQTIECRLAKIDKVTVFTDRAEIRRNLLLKLEKGFNEIDIVHIPGEVIDDSVRISGTGEALIHEVQFSANEATKEEKDCPQAKSLREKLQILEQELRKITNERKVAKKQRDSLDQLLDKMGNVGETRSLQMNDSTLQGISQMMVFHRSEVTKLDDLDMDLEKKEIELQERATVLKSDLQPYDSIGCVRTVKVVLEVSSDLQIDLCLCYQVRKAQWRPTYDIRVDIEDEKKMNVTYFGQVSQNSGEEWSGCELVLSTACPSLGGNLPDLGTLDVFLEYHHGYRAKQGFGFGGAKELSKASGPKFAYRSTMLDDECEEPSGRKMSLQVAKAKIKELMLFSEFAIARPAEIPPDGAEHKVTIGVASLVPALHYECVPSKSSDVYLMASATNDSTLSFLPGQTAIFMDGNFVTKSSMKAVSPGEHFVVGLGIDSSIRVDSKPPHNKASGNEEKWFSSKRIQTVRDQKITIKNTRKEKILLKVKEHVPRSTDEKIKVKLLSPDVSQVIVRDVEEQEKCHPGVILNKTTNNLEWTMEISGQEKRDLSIQTQIEFPAGQPIAFAERF